MKGQISACHSSTEGKMDSGQEQLNCRKIGLSTSMYTGVCSTSCVSWFKSEGAAGTRGRNELKAPRSPSGLRNMGPPECGPNESLILSVTRQKLFSEQCHNRVRNTGNTPTTTGEQGWQQIQLSVSELPATGPSARPVPLAFLAPMVKD